MDNKYLSFEEQNELIKKSISGDQSATMALINLCYPIARKIAKRYTLSSNVDIQDLMQEAIYGILLAIPRFDPSQNTKFTTYATFWILKMMRQFAESNFIRCPEVTIEEFKKYTQFSQGFLMENGRYPTNVEICESMGFSDNKLKSLQEIPVSYLVLDEVTPFIPSSEKKVEDVAMLHVLLEDALEAVSEEERYVIIRRFGLQSEQFHTFKEIANDLGISKEWARQLEITGLKKMKKYFVKMNFDYTD